MGSIENDNGIPQTIGILNNLERLNDAIILIALTNLLKVKYLRRLISKLILIFDIEDN